MVNGEVTLKSKSISLYDGEAALLQIFIPGETPEDEPVCIFKKILIGSGDEPELNL